MPSEDEPVPELGALECTVGLNEVGGQVLPVAPHIEMDRPPHNVAADVAPDSAGNSRHLTLSTASTVPSEDTAAAVGAATVMPAQQMTPLERQCEDGVFGTAGPKADSSFSKKLNEVKCEVYETSTCLHECMAAI